MLFASQWSDSWIQLGHTHLLHWCRLDVEAALHDPVETVMRSLVVQIVLLLSTGRNIFLVSDATWLAVARHIPSRTSRTYILALY
jgi:hypothetical protein